ncbi:MAG: hypothetical protein QF619_07825 [Candidatus Binatia bacterium]|nr:hypothetical protein [Candidatus Binatia bacterium]
MFYFGDDDREARTEEEMGHPRAKVPPAFHEDQGVRGMARG